MRSSWKIAVVSACAVLICAGAVLWLVRRSANERRIAAAVSAYRAGAERGDANAQYNLGHLYAHGWGVPRDYSAAIGWFSKAADQGNAKAEAGLGWSYYYGYGVQRDYAEAMRWFRKSADQGDAYAQYNLGGVYYHGYAVRQDYAEADRWFLKAANQGVVGAQADLGYAYFYGLGVPRDRDEADRWYRKAADQGDEYSQRALGLRTTLTGFGCKVGTGLALIAGVFFLIGSRSTKLRERNLEQRTLFLAGLLGVLYGVLGLFAYSPYGIFPSAFAANAFLFCTGLILGIFAGLIVSTIWRNCKKKLLVISGILFTLQTGTFVGLYLYGTAHHRESAHLFRLQAPYPLEGNLIGLAISAAILHRLWRSRSGESEDDDVISQEPDENADQGAGLCAGEN